MVDSCKSIQTKLDQRERWKDLSSKLSAWAKKVDAGVCLNRFSGFGVSGTINFGLSTDACAQQVVQTGLDDVVQDNVLYALDANAGSILIGILSLRSIDTKLNYIDQNYKVSRARDHTVLTERLSDAINNLKDSYISSNLKTALASIENLLKSNKSYGEMGAAIIDFVNSNERRYSSVIRETAIKSQTLFDIISDSYNNGAREHTGTGVEEVYNGLQATTITNHVCLPSGEIGSAIGHLSSISGVAQLFHRDGATFVESDKTHLADLCKKTSEIYRSLSWFINTDTDTGILQDLLKIVSEMHPEPVDETFCEYTRSHNIGYGLVNVQNAILIHCQPTITMSNGTVINELNDIDNPLHMAIAQALSQQMYNEVYNSEC